MGQYCFARCRLSASSVVVCNARGRSAAAGSGACPVRRSTLQGGTVWLRLPCFITLSTGISHPFYVTNETFESIYIFLPFQWRRRLYDGQFRIRELSWNGCSITSETDRCWNAHLGGLLLLLFITPQGSDKMQTHTHIQTHTSTIQQ